MLEPTDAQLLREYVEHRDEAAFRELVNRHADVVYASALRQVGSPDLARDIAQGVFTDLARKAQPLAGTLTGDTSLLGWLFRSTRFLALNQLRDDRRRQARERQAMEDFDPASETTPEWERVQPVLDEAMADLSDEDRDALLLRFFKNRDFRTIGVALGVSDDAAQKRVSRVLERLRSQLTSRGVTTTAVALSTVLSTNALPLAPAGLAATLATAALAGTTFATATTATTLKTVAMTTLQKTLITVTLTAAVGIGIYEARQASKLRDDNQALQQQQAPIAAQLGQLQRTYNDATTRLASLSDDNERLNRNTAELLKLRGELGLLRGQIAATKAKQEVTTNQMQFSAPYRPYLRREEWSDKGTDNPANTILTMFWAIRQGNETKLEQIVSRAYASQELDLLTLPKRDWDKTAGVQIVRSVWFRGGMPGGKMEDMASVETIVEQAPPSDGEINTVEVHKWSLKKANDQWLITGEQ